jgi:hypothetical protein
VGDRLGENGAQATFQVLTQEGAEAFVTDEGAEAFVVPLVGLTEGTNEQVVLGREVVQAIQFRHACAERLGKAGCLHGPTVARTGRPSPPGDLR